MLQVFTLNLAGSCQNSIHHGTCTGDISHCLTHAFFIPQENPDLFKWITGQLPPSEDMEKNPAFQVR